MQKNFVFSLEMFASKFGFDLKDLKWGIRIFDKTIKHEFDFSPIILINGKQGYICIENDRIEPTFLPNVDYVFEEATMHEDDNNYIFKSKTAQTILEKEATNKFYASKYYSSNTEKYIFGD